MDYATKVKQYCLLKRQKDLIDKRLESLNKEIKDYLVNNEADFIQVDQFRVALQKRRSKAKVDDHILEQLLVDKNLYAEASKRVVDHDAVEQLYLNGKLTDDDLRSIGVEPKFTLALTVEENDECTKE